MEVNTEANESFMKVDKMWTSHPNFSNEFNHGGEDEQPITAYTTPRPSTLIMQVKMPHHQMAEGRDAKISLPPIAQQRRSHPTKLDKFICGGEKITNGRCCTHHTQALYTAYAGRLATSYNGCGRKC